MLCIKTAKEIDLLFISILCVHSDELGYGFGVCNK